MIARLDELVGNDDVFGNKAKNLGILIASGIKVPEGVGISYHEHWKYKEGKLSAEQINQRLLLHITHMQGPYSVRSSGDVEDSKDRSFAGQFRTELDIDEIDLPIAIKRVYGSAETKGAYEKGDVKMGVIVQQMITGNFSGVIFTHNLIDDDPDSIMMEISPEGCDSTVSGKTNPSLYVIDKKSGEISLYDEGSAQIPLGKQHIREILYSANKIEQIFGHAQDIEMIMQGYKFNCLQSRDITTLR